MGALAGCDAGGATVLLGAGADWLSGHVPGGAGRGRRLGTAGAWAPETAGTGGSPASRGHSVSRRPVRRVKRTASLLVASRARMFAADEAFTAAPGLGGDFRYGTADGPPARKLCTEIAEQSLPGNCRTWRAFLSTSAVNAIARVGAGPWYDRLNRTIANNLTELAETRPGGITVSSILNNLPNEDGTPHHNEEVGCEDLNDCADNHDVLTGANRTESLHQRDVQRLWWRLWRRPGLPGRRLPRRRGKRHGLHVSKLDALHADRRHRAALRTHLANG